MCILCRVLRGSPTVGARWPPEYTAAVLAALGDSDVEASCVTEARAEHESTCMYICSFVRFLLLLLAVIDPRFDLIFID